MRHQLHQAGVDEDAGGDAIEDAIDDERRLAAGGIGVAHAEPDGQGEGGAEGVGQAQPVGRVPLARGPGGGGESGAEAEALEGLVEDEHDVEGGELGAGDGEGEADKDGVEDDAELEDEDGRHLRAVVGRGFVLVDLQVVVDVLARVAEVVVAGGVAVLGAGGGKGAVSGRGGRGARGILVRVRG